eukprot:gene7276-9918_t
MTSGNFTEKQDAIERILYDTVIDPWIDILDKFQKNPQLHKAGYGCSPAGWVWFNFMWVRASYYLHHVVCPVITPRRHYYEDWIARKTNRILPKIDHITFNNHEEIGEFTSSSRDCLSLCRKNIPIGAKFEVFDTWDVCNVTKPNF